MSNDAKPVFAVDVVEWSEIRNEVKKVNPELGRIIDQISPDKKHKLLKARYKFGDKIVDEGKLNLPTLHGEIVPIDSPYVSTALKNYLDYSAIPLSLILEKSNEVFVTAGERVIPLNYFMPGDLFGLFEAIDLIQAVAKPRWTVTSGARSIFMLPRVTDDVGYKRIRRNYNINIETPKSLSEQADFFTKIVNHSKFSDSWCNEILFFPKNWLHKANDNKGWSNFDRYLLRESWIQQQLFRDTVEFGLMWASFTSAIINRNLKPRPYLVDTIKHLISIANGVTVAFKPATDDLGLPIQIIQEVMLNDYGLKNYIPSIIQPCKFNGKEPVYYSLAYPTVLGSMPHSKNAPSIIEDERDIKRLIETLINALKDQRGGIYDPIQNVNYEFFHGDKDRDNEIQSTMEMHVTDPRFTHMSYIDDGKKEFCSTAPFLRGCIKISSK